MTIYRSVLTRGYFPKELPPAFFTDQFAAFATTKNGRAVLETYGAEDNYTECVKFSLARVGSERRELKIPHPALFAKLAVLTAAHFGRLLKKAGSSPFSKSRPFYATNRQRAIAPMFSLSNLAREKSSSRAGASFLLKADVSHFYPSLYTHAVGWAVDPKLRDKANWKNWKLLGKQLDQILMDIDGKISQGIPIGNDISFLLSEIVLAQVDRAMKVRRDRAYRWYDDYEIAFDTRHDAQVVLRQLTTELGRFRLRLNPVKTEISELPQATNDEWQDLLIEAGKRKFTYDREMVRYFDFAFRLRELHPKSAILTYALGVLFRLRCPSDDVGRVAQSCISQAILCEPGAAQKAFALLSYWALNKFKIDTELWTSSIDRLITQHAASGITSDVAWALAFCLDHKLTLNSNAGNVLASIDDDCVAIQALHMKSLSLIPRGFDKRRIARLVKEAGLDREHWLLAYEAVRHGFITTSASAVKSNKLFSELLARKVTFYRTQLPEYALVIHPGGAPEWVVRGWVKLIADEEHSAERIKKAGSPPILKQMKKDLQRVRRSAKTVEDILANLMDRFENRAVEEAMEGETYH